MSDVVTNYRNIISQISKFHKEFSQTSKNPNLIAVSKTFPEEVIKKLLKTVIKFLERIKYKKPQISGHHLKDLQRYRASFSWSSPV